MNKGHVNMVISACNTFICGAWIRLIQSVVWSTSIGILPVLSIIERNNVFCHPIHYRWNSYYKVSLYLCMERIQTNEWWFISYNHHYLILLFGILHAVDKKNGTWKTSLQHSFLHWDLPFKLWWNGQKDSNWIANDVDPYFDCPNFDSFHPQEEEGIEPGGIIPAFAILKKLNVKEMLYEIYEWRNKLLKKVQEHNRCQNPVTSHSYLFLTLRSWVILPTAPCDPQM